MRGVGRALVSTNERGLAKIVELPRTDLAPVEFAFLGELTAKLAEAQNEAELLTTFPQLAAERFCATCAIHLIDESGALTPGLDAVELTALHDAARTGQALVLEAGSLIFVPLLAACSNVGIVSFASAPLVPFDQAAVAAATIAGRILALALASARAFAREVRLTQRFAYLEKAKNELVTTLDPNQMFQQVASALIGLADGVVVYFAERERLHAIAATHRDPERAALLETLVGTQPFRPDTEQTIVQRLRTQPPSTIVPVTADDLRATFRPSAAAVFESLQARTELTVPFYADDVLAGTLVAYSSEVDFTPSDVEVFEEIGRFSTLALNHARSFARERRLTKVLQEAALPAQLPGIHGAILSSFYLPASTEVKVGGDWYDAFTLDEHRVLLSIGDVTGHGLEASVIMSKLRHTFNAVALFEQDPSAIIDAAEAVLKRRFPNAIATAFVGIYDSRDHRITYANAGHPWPIIRLEDGSLRELSGSTDLPIGLRWMQPREPTASASLDGASLLVLYTDGLIESTRDPLEGMQKLEECLRAEATLHVNSAAAFIESYCLSGPAPDDVTALVLKFADTVRWSFEIEDVRAAQRTRRAFVDELERRCEPGSEIETSELILGELLGNVRRHAPGAVDVALEFFDRRVVLHVIDRGPGISGRKRGPVEPLAEAGRGLWLVQQLGRGLRVESFPRFGSHVSSVLPVDVSSRAVGPA
jgi:serine phosphatase RsbU (regulator of sigma subunit)/anti-sigma regulatory factor (Ser/Thr protein kinase)